MRASGSDADDDYEYEHRCAEHEKSVVESATVIGIVLVIVRVVEPR
jgi:hypothetical protein